MKKSTNSSPKKYRKERWRRVLALTLVCNLLLTALSASFTAQPVQASADIFIDAAGTQWRVLRTDLFGNRLIISEHVYGAGTQFNTSNTFVRWHEMTTAQPIRVAINNFWTNNVGADVKALALPANNLNSDVRTAPGSWNSNENAPAGWTSAGTGTPTAENSLFIFSVSEVNRYADAGSLNRVAMRTADGAAATWWLRSPGGSSTGTVAFVDTYGFLYGDADASYTYRGFRPALWIKPANGGGSVDLPPWLQNSPTPITFPNTPTQLPPHLLNSPTPITFPNTPTQLPPHLLNSPTPITFPNTPTQLPPHLLNSPTPITFVPTNTPLPGHLLTPKVAHNANG